MTMKFKALILAGGYGTRLKPITNNTPKCLVPIHGKPLLGHWLEHLASIGCRSVLINKHYLSHKVDEFLSTINFPEMNISTVFEKNLLGTAGTLIKNTAIKTGEIFGSVKKKIKGDSTYANALINSQRLDQKISESSIQKAKKGGYYSMIYIELEKN